MLACAGRLRVSAAVCQSKLHPGGLKATRLTVADSGARFVKVLGGVFVQPGASQSGGSPHQPTSPLLLFSSSPPQREDKSGRFNSCLPSCCVPSNNTVAYGLRIVRQLTQTYLWGDSRSGRQMPINRLIKGLIISELMLIFNKKLKVLSSTGGRRQISMILISSISFSLLSVFFYLF